MKIRLPAEMKVWLEQEAARNLRSMTQEIVLSVRDRMERQQSTTGQSLPAHPAADPAETARGGDPVTHSLEAADGPR